MSFESFKQKITNALVLALPNFQEPFETEIDASEYAMGAILMQGRKTVYYHLEKFSGVVMNYPTYNKELFSLVQVVKKWKNYLMGRETIVHTDHQPLQYLQTKSKLQQTQHLQTKHV